MTVRFRSDGARAAEEPAAARWGLPSAAAFSRLFRATYGVTPFVRERMHPADR